MKNLFLSLCLASLVLSSGCATVFGGKITECQRTKPAPGQPARAIRVVALAADIIVPTVAALSVGVFPFGVIVWTGVDCIDHAIYKPCDKDKK